MIFVNLPHLGAWTSCHPRDDFHWHVCDRPGLLHKPADQVSTWRNQIDVEHKESDKHGNGQAVTFGV